MAIQQHQRAVGAFPTRREAEDALNELRNSGFPMEQVSVLAKDSDGDDNIAGADVKDSTGNEAREGAGAGAVAGTALGGVGGLLVGLGALAIPGAGPFLAAGTLATTFAGAGIGAAAGGIVGGLVGLGIPEEQAKVYSTQVSQGGYLVMVEGSELEIRRAASILSNRGIREWAVFDAPNTYDSAPAQGYTAAPASVVNDASDVYSDRTATNQDVVEIVDHRRQQDY